MNKKQMNALKNSAYNPNLKPHPWGDWADESVIPTEDGRTWKRFTDGYELIDLSGEEVVGFTRQISKKGEDGLMTTHHGAWLNDGASVVDLGSFDTVRQARQAVEEKLNG